MSKSPFRIVIIDDEHERSEGWAGKLRNLELDALVTDLGFSGLRVDALGREEAATILQAAEMRRSGAREGVDPFSGDRSCDLDCVDVLVIDYDLQEFINEGQWSTGLQIAVLARAFTRVKLVIVVNQFATNSFDLTLIQAAASQADMDVGSDQLLNPALWDCSRKGDFSPWLWNDGAVRGSLRIESTVQWVLARLDEKILPSLGFDMDAEHVDSERRLLPVLWQKFLKSPDQTFRELAAEAEFLGVKDRSRITKYDESCARIAAAVICHWLDRWVIPANDILIDLPHLASAFPWLLQGMDDVSCWQHSADVQSGFSALQPGLEAHLFKPGFPLSRPVLWRLAVMSDSAFAEPTGFNYEGFPDLVFCEDTSRFEEFKNSRVFESELPSADLQRFVARSEFDDSRSDHAISSVIYEPSVRFTL